MEQDRNNCTRFFESRCAGTSSGVRFDCTIYFSVFLPIDKTVKVHYALYGKDKMVFSHVHVFVMEILSLSSSVQSLVRAVQHTSSHRVTFDQGMSPSLRKKQNKGWAPQSMTVGEKSWRMSRAFAGVDALLRCDVHACMLAC